VSDYFAKTARDMLAKARREFRAMQSDLNPDTIGDFFTTVSHVMDYVKADLGIPLNAGRAALPLAVQQMYHDPDMQTARELNNLRKHARLDPTRRQPSSPSYISHSDSAFVEPQERYTATQGGARIDFEAVGSRLIQKLEISLDALGL